MILERTQKPTNATTLQRGARSWLTLGVALFFITFIYTFFITYGSGKFLQEEFLGKAFDSIGRHVIHGEVSIDIDAGKWEIFRTHGKAVMYFGPLPGFLRYFGNRIFPAMYGKWSRLFMLTASALCLLAALMILELALLANQSLTLKQKRHLQILCLLGFGLGTPLLFLMSCGFIYHEANIWGLCCGLWGVYFVLKTILRPELKLLTIFGLACAAGLALISRVTFSVPLYLILGALALIYWLAPALKLCGSSFHFDWSAVKNLGQRKFIALLCKKFPALFLACTPALLSFVFQLWYNYSRFGSLFTFANYTRYASALDAHHNTIQELGGMMNLKRIPIALYYYFGLSSHYFLSHFPFVRLYPAQPASLLYPTGFVNGPEMYVISISLVSPWLLFGAALGLLTIARQRKTFFLWLCVLAFVVQMIFITSYYWIATRYSSEFLLLWIFLFSIFLAHLRADTQQAFRRKVAALTLLVVFSIGTTLLSTLEYTIHYKVGIPKPYQQAVSKVIDALQ